MISLTEKETKTKLFCPFGEELQRIPEIHCRPTMVIIKNKRTVTTDLYAFCRVCKQFQLENPNTRFQDLPALYRKKYGPEPELSLDDF